MSYKIKLEIFEGPLDLLLYLIKKDHIDIYDIPIASVLSQYMQYLELMKLLDLNIAGEFLVMGATLMQIKSKMLLPPDETTVPEEEEMDPRLELVNRLLEYKKFKEVAEELRAKEASRSKLFTRQVGYVPDEETEEKEVYFEASLFDLITAFTKALKDIPKDIFYEVIKDEFTVDEKIHQILHTLLETTTINLSELFNKARNKLEIVSTFLAVLELIRLKEIVVRQRSLFGDIVIIRNKENITPQPVKTTS